ncbi:MAG: 30S ribosomal protein S18 [Armatimonadota bacterium]
MNEDSAEPQDGATAQSKTSPPAGVQQAALTEEATEEAALAERPTPADKEDDRRDASPGRARPRRRRRVSFLSQNKIRQVDYKDVAVLKRFINDEGKILGRRHTGATAKEQRMIARAIRRAREMALLPFVALDSSGGGRGRPRSPYDPGLDRSHDE